MADLKAWQDKHYGATRPSSPLGKAVEYLHKQWAALQVYLSDGGVCIDNNRVENHLRPICVGKKNYLFAGSDEGAERAAVIYTVLANCKLAGAEPWAYSTTVTSVCQTNPRPTAPLDTAKPPGYLRPDPEKTTLATLPK